MQQSFSMPDVGEGLTEAEIVDWRVSVGDTVIVNQILVEVETAKAVVELPSPYAGTVTELLFAPGDTVNVGATIITISDSRNVEKPTFVTRAQPADENGELMAESAAANGQANELVLVGYGVTPTTVRRRPRKPGWSMPDKRLRPGNQRPYAKPPVRHLARTLGVDIGGIPPTGPQGEVTRNDVMTAAAQTAATPSDPERGLPGQPAHTRIPIKGIRKQIADAMVRSAFTAPHVTEWVNVDITRSVKLLEKLRADRAWAGVRITPLTLLARAVTYAVTRHPEINATLDAAASEIVQHRDLNLGIAVASPRGLIVPNIRAAQSLSFRELADAMNNLIEQARGNQTKPEHMRNGTLTITNVGVFGIDGATPILNTGESAILAFGRTSQLPWNHKGKVKLRAVTTLSLSFDHRLVDGELGSLVLTDIAAVMERPELMFVA
jgi:2-oxoisovalerate dehydrogenase E2 component (dihydrolipoyl transacylase)